MPTTRTIKNRHQGYDEWRARAITYYGAMGTEALADRLREETGLFTSWDSSERNVIYDVLEKRHPEIDAATRRLYVEAPAGENAVTTYGRVSAVILAAIAALPAAALASVDELT